MTLSVVVIGRNEGSRLEGCLHSVLTMAWDGPCPELLYVDSGSSDGSAELAEALGVKVIRLEMEGREPSAARARNAGWRAGSGELCLFLDGDTLLDSDFVKHALPSFEEPRVAVVCGERRELRPKVSVYNRVFDLDWNGVAGDVAYCGGDALVRRSALVESAGYDATLIAGEEPELCTRLRLAGWRIVRLAVPMTRHDLAMTGVGQYWRRGVRTGYAYAEVSRRLAGTAMPLWGAEARANRTRALALGALLLALSLGAATWAAGGGVVGLPAMLAVLAILAGIALRSAWKARRIHAGVGSWTLLLYGLHSHLQQIPIFAGQMRFHREQRQGARRGLVEYK